MGYFDQVSMDDSNRTQRERFAANPVIANQGPLSAPDATAGTSGATTARAAGPISTYVTDLSGGLVDTTPPAAPSPGPTLAAQYGPDVAGGNPVGTEFSGTPANATIAPSLKTPRTGTFGISDEPYGGPDNNRGSSALASAAAALPTGPISTMIGRSGEVLPAGITRNGTAYSGTGDAPAPGMTTEQSNAYYGGIRQAGDALDRQNLADRSAAAARAAATPNSRDIDRAEGDARVANFLAKNGVATGPTIRGFNQDRQTLIAGAGAANANLAAMRGQAQAGAAVPPRNYIDDFTRSQEAGFTGQKNAQGLEGGALDIQGKKLSMAAQKQLSALDAQIAGEKDPKKLAVLTNQRLAIAGKPADTKVAVIDADTGQKDMMGQPIYKKVAINTQTGEMLGGNTAGAQAPAGKYPTPIAATIQQLKAHPETRAQFEQFYGAGSAAQYLK